MKITWKGIIKVVVKSEDKSELELQFHNDIVNTGLNMVRDALAGDVTDLRIKYMAWGSSNQAVDPGDTKLVAEEGRKAVTLQADGGTGEQITTVYLAPGEANSPKIEELGWFAGADASEVADSGIMVARTLYSHQKTSLESIQVVRTDKFEGA